MARARPQDHWLGEPPLLVKPVIRLLSQFIQRPFFKKVRGDPAGRCLRRGGLGPILTEFRDEPFSIRVRPGAALTVKTILLIDFEERFEHALHAHFVQAVLHRLKNGWYPG